MQEQTYDVALWRYFPATFPDHMAYVSATTPLMAILKLMEECAMNRVQHAAARLPGGPIVAYHVIRVYENGVYTEEDTSRRR